MLKHRLRFQQSCSCEVNADTKVRLGGNMNNMILLVFLEASAVSDASRYIKWKLEK